MSKYSLVFKFKTKSGSGRLKMQELKRLEIENT